MATNVQKTSLLAVAALAGVAVILATGAAVVTQAQTGAIADEKPAAEHGAIHNETDDDSVSPDDVALTGQEAVEIATNEVAGTALEVELENEDGTSVYEVEVRATRGDVREVEIDADEGTVLEVERDDADGDDDEVDNETRVTVSGTLESLAGEDYRLDGLAIDIGAEWYTSNTTAKTDFDGDGTVETIRAEFDGLVGESVTLTVETDGTEGDVFAVEGAQYREQGPPPWAGGPDGHGPPEHAGPPDHAGA